MNSRGIPDSERDQRGRVWSGGIAGVRDSAIIFVTNRWPSEIRSISIAIASIPRSTRSSRSAESFGICGARPGWLRFVRFSAATIPRADNVSTTPIATPGPIWSRGRGGAAGANVAPPTSGAPPVWIVTVRDFPSGPTVVIVVGAFACASGAALPGVAGVWMVVCIIELRSAAVCGVRLSSVHRILLYFRPQSRQPIRQARFHGPDAQLERLGDFRMAQAVDVVHPDNELACTGQS